MELINVLMSEKLEINCSGKGESLNKAIEDAFRDMRIKVVEKIGNPIVTILTKEVYLIKKETNSRQEAFMYFFAKRNIIEHHVNLKMIIDISYLKI